MAMARGFCSRPSEIPRRPQTASKRPTPVCRMVAAGGQQGQQERQEMANGRLSSMVPRSEAV